MESPNLDEQILDPDAYKLSEELRIHAIEQRLAKQLIVNTMKSEDRPWKITEISERVRGDVHALGGRFVMSSVHTAHDDLIGDLIVELAPDGIGYVLGPRSLEDQTTT